jgi:hypothetical protein
VVLLRASDIGISSYEVSFSSIGDVIEIALPHLHSGSVVAEILGLAVRRKALDADLLGRSLARLAIHSARS